MIDGLNETIQECPESQWAQEMKAEPIVFQNQNGQFGLGKSIPCPNCKTVGFYGPRVSPALEAPTRKYRACKFCGFWQEVWGDGYDKRGGKPYRCIHLTCKNENCRTPNWTAANEGKSCDMCHSSTIVSKWATDDSSHPFHKLKALVPQN